MALNPDVITDHGGWLRVDYSGPELSVIEMEVPGSGWIPAYLDYRGGQRCAQVRWEGPLPAAVALRVDGEIVATWP